MSAWRIFHKRHHLVRLVRLECWSVTEILLINRIANSALLEQPDNMSISDDDRKLSIDDLPNLLHHVLRRQLWSTLRILGLLPRFAALAGSIAQNGGRWSRGVSESVMLDRRIRLAEECRVVSHATG